VTDGRGVRLRVSIELGVREELAVAGSAADERTRKSVVVSGDQSFYPERMHAPVHPRTLAWRVLLCGTLIGLVPSAARAATCTYNSSSATVSVSVGSGTTTLSVSGGNIMADGSGCGGATVTSTDTIDVSATGGTLVIDLSGGPFAPGQKAESSGASEIEFTANLGGGTLGIQGSDGPDTIAAGSDGVNLNAEENADDVDVTLTTVASMVGNGGNGNDRLTWDGREGTGSISTIRGEFDGGDGNDLLAGSGVTDTIAGGTGTDTVDYSAATISVYIRSLPNSTVTSTTGSDELTGIENAIGSPAGDYLYGGAARNVLRGGGGHDVFRGRGGDDLIVGGPGSDRIDLSRSPKRLVVDLARGKADGEGHDTLRKIENVIGSKYGDRIKGTRGANSIDGLAGADLIVSGAGNDLLRAGDGGDTLKAGAGDDQAYGDAGRDAIDGGTGYDVCSDGADTAFRNCEIT
jgi:Ca2+-binding RTX toxin-like protein